MRILVTGSSGFIGGSLVRRLVADGHEVWGWSRRYAPDGGIPADRHVSGDIVAGVPARLPRDLHAIIHCAGVASPSAAVADPVRAFSVNAGGSAAVLEAARPGRTPVILASSVNVYDGCTERPWHEELPLCPRSVLGASKVAAEAFARSYWSCYGVPSIALRLSTVFGPGAGRQQFVASTFAKIEKARAELRAAEFGTGEATRDFVYIDDVLQAFASSIALVVVRPDHHVLNIGTGVERTIRVAVTAMLSVMGPPPVEVAYDRLPTRPDEPATASRHVVAVGRAAAVLGWRAEVPFEEGLRRTYSWLRETRVAER